jgi:TolB-like protein
VVSITRDEALGGAVLTALAAALGVGLWPWLPPLRARPAAAVFDRSLPAVAVIPFTTISADPVDALFGDGLTEDLLAQLTKLGGLRVLPSGHVNGYGDRASAVAAIADEPGARIVQGSVRRERDRIRIAVQLVDAATAEYVWSETYDRGAAEILLVQAEIARRIATALGMRLRAGSEGVEATTVAGAEAFDLPLSQVAFWRWLGDRRDLFVMNTDGTGQRNLTNDSAPELAPAWSPDGSTIAYISAGDIYLVKADGSDPRRLTNRGQDNDPSWSPDGTRLVFSRGERDRPADIHSITRTAPD